MYVCVCLCFPLSVNNNWNQFKIDIFKQRLKKYLYILVEC